MSREEMKKQMCETFDSVMDHWELNYEKKPSPLVVEAKKVRTIAKLEDMNSNQKAIIEAKSYSIGQLNEVNEKLKRKLTEQTKTIEHLELKLKDFGPLKTYFIDIKTSVDKAELDGLLQ